MRERREEREREREREKRERERKEREIIFSFFVFCFFFLFFYSFFPTPTPGCCANEKIAFLCYYGFLSLRLCIRVNNNDTKWLLPEELKKTRERKNRERETAKEGTRFSRGRRIPRERENEKARRI